MQEGVESIGKFLVSGCDTAELFEAIEESLDEVSCLVAVPVDFAFGVAIASRWDDRFGTGGLDDVDQGIAVVTLSAMTAPVGIASTKAAPCVTSATWPAVRIKRTGLPRASTQA